MTAVVFSRNRAMQLDALLRSIQTWARGVFDAVVVLYRAEPEFQPGYEIVTARHKSWATIIRRKHFRSDTLQALDSAKYWACFLTDDDLFYGLADRSWQPILDDTVLCMSLRLGMNTTYCYPLDRQQPLPAPLLCQDEFMSWDWTSAALDFSYPFSIDGHCFRVEDLRRMIGSFEFETPNQLEARWQSFQTDHSRPCMMSYYRSCLVNLPLNRVQNEYANRFEGGAVEELNKRFLEGWVIDSGAMDFSGVRGAHFPVPLQFCRPN